MIRMRRPRGSTRTGCLVFVLVLPVVTTFGMYYAETLRFHLWVGAVAAALCALCALRGLRAEAVAFSLIALPAAVSAWLLSSGAVAPAALGNVSGLLYMAGPLLFAVVAVYLAIKYMPPEENEDASPDR